jgi:transposase-like protein
VTERVAEAVSCACGYRGPTVTIGGQAVCPICRAAAAAPALPGMPALPTRPTLPAAHPAQTAAPQAATKQKTYRIPCPRGHVLTAKPHMLEQQVVCPECNELFTLRAEDSLEHRKQQARARHAEEERIAKLWLKRSIWAAAFIVASLVGMIAFSVAFRAPLPPPAEEPSEPAPAVQSE